MKQAYGTLSKNKTTSNRTALTINVDSLALWYSVVIHISHIMVDNLKTLAK